MIIVVGVNENESIPQYPKALEIPKDTAPQAQKTKMRTTKIIKGIFSINISPFIDLKSYYIWNK